jgi:hypothetical protein
MLRPNLTTQGQFICESEEGKAFAYRDFCEEFEYCGANALPLQIGGKTTTKSTKTANLVGAKHYRHHLRISSQSAIGNAIAQTPQRRDNLSARANRVKHLRTEIF